MKTSLNRTAHQPPSISGARKRDYTERYKKRKFRRLLISAGIEQRTQAELDEQAGSKIRNKRHLEKKKCVDEETKVRVTLKQTEGLKENKVREEGGKSVCIKAKKGRQKKKMKDTKLECNKSGLAEESTIADHQFVSSGVFQADVAQPEPIDLTTSKERANEVTTLQVKDSHDKILDGTYTYRKRKQATASSSLSPGTIKDRTIDISSSPPKQHDQRPLVLLSIVDNPKEFAYSNSVILHSNDSLLPDSTALMNIIDTTSEIQEKAETLLRELKHNTSVSIYNSPVGFRTEITYFPGGTMMLDASLTSYDLHQLLAPAHFLTDASINYYRCLLMREELRRWHRFKTSGWRKCIIHSTLFMTVLSEGDFDNTFDKAKRIDHELIGKFSTMHHCFIVLAIR